MKLSLTESEGRYSLQTNLYDYLPEFEVAFINTSTLGEAFEPEQKFEAPDGSPILFDRDFFGSNLSGCWRSDAPAILQASTLLGSGTSSSPFSTVSNKSPVSCAGAIHPSPYPRFFILLTWVTVVLARFTFRNNSPSVNRMMFANILCALFLLLQNISF